MESSSPGIYRENPLERRSSEELRRLLDRAVAASSNGILITDPNLPDDPIVYVNPAFETITGYAAAEALGRNCRFLQGEDRVQAQLEQLRAALGEGRGCRVVLRNYKKDGTLFWNELYISPVYNDEGRLTHFVGVQNDVTERRRIEEERDRLLARERQARSEAVAVRRRLELLASTEPALYSSLDSGSMLEKIAHLLVPELADWCLVDVVDEEGAPRQVAAVHADPTKRELLHRLLDHRRLDGDAAGTVAQVLGTGRSVLVPEVSDALLAESATSGEHLELLRRLEGRSIISVPLLARGRTLGALTLVSSRPERRYGEEDLSLAEALAYRCALAVENSRLYRERSYIARTLQRSLLPRLPDVPGVEVGIEYLPVGEENEVGGDFYDLIEAGGMGETGCWIAVIGDVCGKGAAAAAATALTRYTVRAVAMRENEPAKILSDLNEAMIRQEEDNQFCTVACARLEPLDDGDLELVVARAGHPSPLLLRADGAVEAIDPPGKVIGVFEDPELESCTVRLGAGDAAVFYTDGLLEARGPDGSIFGEERLVGLVRSCAGLTAPATAERLRDVTLKFGEGSRRDDLAVLVLRVPETLTA